MKNCMYIYNANNNGRFRSVYIILYLRSNLHDNLCARHYLFSLSSSANTIQQAQYFSALDILTNAYFVFFPFRFILCTIESNISVVAKVLSLLAVEFKDTAFVQTLMMVHNFVINIKARIVKMIVRKTYTTISKSDSQSEE